MNEPLPILEFEAVHLDPPEDGRWDTGLTHASFRLNPGEFLGLALEPGFERHPLPDLACGLRMPDAGAVRFLGAAWTGAAPDEAAARRGRIGQVFGEGGWLSNLDLDENITLPLRYHARLSPDAARETALEWARAFGLKTLPTGRPDRAVREILRVAQWIRAFSLRPDLLLLDRPSDGLSPEWTGRLLAATDRERARGAAVLWLTETPTGEFPLSGRCRGDQLLFSTPAPGGPP